MKNIKLVLLAVVCVIGLTACGGQDQKKADSEGKESLNAAGDLTAGTFISNDAETGAVGKSDKDIKISVPDNSFKVKPSFGIEMEDRIAFILGSTLSDVEGYELKADIDLSTTLLKSEEIKKDILLRYKDAVLTVAAINPYENEAPLADCIICNASSEDTTGVFAMDSSGDMCGKASYDDLTFNDIYEKTEDLLVYKTFLLTRKKLTVNFGSKDPKGKKILEATGDADLILDFENGILKRFTFISPELYYRGMQDNIEENTITSIDDSTMEAAKKVRDDILSELKAAFEKEKIDVDINDKTGEIVMGNDILFALDSYDLSDDGKDYIDRFMGVYASVVFGDKYSDSIKEVRFEGHTDSSGEEEHNAVLSKKRADAIMNYCMESDKNTMTSEQKKLLKKVAKSAGYASSDLVYDENGNEDPEKSRRASIKFFVNVE